MPPRKKFRLMGTGVFSVLKTEKAGHWLACLGIVLAVALAYQNSLHGPFIFDDFNAIPNNPTIKSLWPLWPVIEPQEGGGTVCGRPVLNLSFALNFAIGGLDVRGYHLGNLLIHALAGLALFGFLRRTFLRPGLRKCFGRDSAFLALGIALMWCLHPLQTASVTYIAQRAESLAGLFYLFSLYLFCRGVEPGASRVWLWVSVAACAIGMGCKEVMVSLPLMALLYDRTFVSGSFAVAWSQRWKIYIALFSTWLLLGFFILSTNSRGGTAGVAEGLSTIQYLQTQCCAILEYLRLTVWPDPLIFDYGTPVVVELRQYLLPGLLVIIALCASLLGAWKKSVYGFFGVWFFAVLAPTSSFVAVVTQTMAIHRMYLPLISVLAVIVLAAYSRIGRVVFPFCAVVALFFGWTTAQRNLDFRSEALIWSDTVKKCPANARALGNLGGIMLREKLFAEALLLLEESVRLDPGDDKVRSNLAVALIQTGNNERGIKELHAVLAMNPQKDVGHWNLGLALMEMGRYEEAEVHVVEFLKINPGDSSALKTLDVIRRKRESPACQ